MNHFPFKAALAALALLAGVSLAQADEPKPAPAPVPVATPKPKAQPAVRKPRPVRSYAGLVELNSATKAQLKTLPGITDALAERIIAARPYYSKAKLNAGVLPAGYYGALHAKVMVKPPPLPTR